MPVKTSFQVGIEIYEDRLGPSGDRILSSHIQEIIMAIIFPVGAGPTAIPMPII